MEQSSNTVLLYKRHQQLQMIRWLSWLCAVPAISAFASMFVTNVAIGSGEAGFGAFIIIAVAAMIYFRYVFLEWRIRTGRFGSWESERLGLAEFALRRQMGA